MVPISISEQNKIIGGDFSWQEFVRGAACGAALVVAAPMGPPGLFAAATGCIAFLPDIVK
jgi:hypothetical protein